MGLPVGLLTLPAAPRAVLAVPWVLPVGRIRPKGSGQRPLIGTIPPLRVLFCGGVVLQTCQHPWPRFNQIHHFGPPSTRHVGKIGCLLYHVLGRISSPRLEPRSLRVLPRAGPLRFSRHRAASQVRAIHRITLEILIAHWRGDPQHKICVRACDGLQC